MPNIESGPVDTGVSRRNFLKVLTAASVATTLAPVISATSQAYAEEIGVPLRGPDGRVIVFHPPMASGIPLGGMGAGTFELRADGGMYEWQIFNNWGQRLVLPDTFFAIRAQEQGKVPVVRRLETIRHTSNPGTPVSNITYEGRFPIARLKYEEPALPVNVSLTAWSPFIPHQSRDSGLPGALFTFELTNPGHTTVHATLLSSIRNGVALNNGWTGTQNKLQRGTDMTAIHMTPRLDSRQSTMSKPVRVLVLMESMPARVKEVLENTPHLTLDTSTSVTKGPIKLPVSTAAELVKQYDVVWLGEIPHASEALGHANMEMIREAVHQGVGLFVTGGQNAFYGASATQWGHMNGTPIEEALPIKFRDSIDTVNALTRIHLQEKTDYMLGLAQCDNGMIGLPQQQSGINHHAVQVDRLPYAATAGYAAVQLAGYNSVAAVKPGANVPLRGHYGAPLLITGDYGRGRTAVWATSVSGGWVPVDGYGGWQPPKWTQMPIFYAGLLAHLARGTFNPGYGVAASDISHGDMTLAVLSADAMAATQWQDAATFWNNFSEHGTLVEQSVPPESTRNAALASAVELAPGETRKITFVLTWNFPNQYTIFNKPEFLGHIYSQWFNNSLEVTREIAQRHEELFARSAAFPNALYAGSLPPKIKDAVNAQLTTFNKETWWVKDGTFAVWEGMVCCGMQTLDVAFYGSTPVSALFPDLQKTSMRLSARHQKPDGEMPHSFPGNFTHPDSWWKLDLMPAFTLMVYRDYLWSGDHHYLREMWPVITKAMAYDQRTDKDKDFLPDDQGADCTFDAWPMNGTTSYVSSMFLAALTAGIRMARVLGDTKVEADYTQWLEKGKKSFESELWNGHYYQMARDITTGIQNTGILLAGTAGQWFADICDLGNVLPHDHVKSHNEQAFHYCRQKTRPGMWYVNPDDGIAYINGFWPHGGKPEGDGQWSAPWTGVEYMFASSLAYAGRADLAETVTTDVYDRYVKRRAPWNHTECGQHYFRALSVWTILLGMQGFRWDAIRRSLGFTPRVSPENHRSLFCTAAGWGEYFANTTGGRRIHRVLLQAGKLALSEFTIGLSEAEGVHPAGNLRVTYDNKLVEVTETKADGRIVITFKRPLLMQAGSSVEISW